MTKQEAIELQKTNKKEYYKRVLAHLNKYDLAFCFTEHGGLISREECEANII